MNNEENSMSHSSDTIRATRLAAVSSNVLRFVSCVAPVAALAFVTAMSPSPAGAQIVANQISFQSRMDELDDQWGNCWGYTDPNTGVEYAILGNESGTAIYNLSDPYKPRRTGVIAGPFSIWKELKVYRNYAYVVSEGGGELEGLQIIDLTNPEEPRLARAYNGAFSTAHTVAIDTANARCYAMGANSGGGGLRILDISNPTNPVLLGNWGDLYVHDAYIRGDTAYCACINAGKLMILDVSNPADIDTIGEVSYPNAATHNAWPTEDNDYVLTCDERGGGHLRVWDITDPTDIIQVDDYNPNPNASSHNVHVRGNLAFISYYTEGLRVLDITNPTNVLEKGFFDEHSGGGLFAGDWGAFPYYPSGSVLISDIAQGGFLVACDWEKGKLTGAVRNAATLAPIAGATVRVVENGWTATTTASGQYTLSLDAGSYTLVAKAFGFADSTSAPVIATTGSTTMTNLSLTAIPQGSVAGVVRDAATNNPLANVWVALEGTALGDSTNASGAYSIPGVPAGAYELHIDELAWIPDSAAIAVSASATTTADRLLGAVFYANEFEDSLGWTSWASGDNATSGRWLLANPKRTGGGFIQPETDHSAGSEVLERRCWVTGNPAINPPATAGDVDGGKTTLRSPNFDLTGAPDPIVQYYRWYLNDAGLNADTDVWRVDVSSNGGANWVTIESTTQSAAEWVEKRIRLWDFIQPSSQVTFRFVAEDAGSESIVEALVDDFRIWSGTPTAVSGPDGGWGAAGAPARVALHANTPNPSRSSTTISFDLPRASDARLTIVSPEGRIVATLVDAAVPPGAHRAIWDGRGSDGRAVASGVYFYRLEAGGEVQTRRMLLVK
jgi:choice-of-anchor B domain-containing protein